MKKVISLLLMITMLIGAVGCLADDKQELKEMQESPSSDQSSKEVIEKESTDSEDESKVATEESKEKPEAKKKIAIEMPVLPDMDFEGLTFKDDGYEIVEFKSLSDGDTANFVVGGMTMPCRFLAIDTPETSGSSGLQPWALAAKAYTKNALENAEVIIIEKDLESDIYDHYGRLLGWIWVDGELLNYKLVEEGLAYVKYLYGNYKYNPQMIGLESKVQKTKIKVWGEKDPNYDYSDTVKEVTIKEARALQTGSSVKIKGIITNIIGMNAFITDDTGSVYIYANKYDYNALDVIGTEIELTGKIIEYNGLAEISSIEDRKITVLSEGHTVTPKDITISDIGEDIEGDLIRIEDVVIGEVSLSDGGGYSIYVSKDSEKAVVRIDKYLTDYPDPESLEKGMVIDVVGSIGQHMDNYQIMIKDSSSVVFK